MNTRISFLTYCQIAIWLLCFRVDILRLSTLTPEVLRGRIVYPHVISWFPKQSRFEHRLLSEMDTESYLPVWLRIREYLHNLPYGGLAVVWLRMLSSARCMVGGLERYRNGDTFRPRPSVGS